MFPGRWNRKGQRAVYAATSKALALNEVVVHLPKNSRPQGYSMLSITLRTHKLIQSNGVVLRRTPESARRWFETVGLALQEDVNDPIAFIAPSVIVPEYNVVLYPRPMNFEPELAHIEAIEEFEFDTRLLGDIALP
jgi:RES domain-containing protein